MCVRWSCTCKFIFNIPRMPVRTVVALPPLRAHVRTAVLLPCRSLFVRGFCYIARRLCIWSGIYICVYMCGESIPFTKCAKGIERPRSQIAYSSAAASIPPPAMPNHFIANHVAMEFVATAGQKWHMSKIISLRAEVRKQMFNSKGSRAVRQVGP